MTIIVRDNGRFSDLHASGAPNQYAVVRDVRGFVLRSLPRAEWETDPRVMDVNTLSGYVDIGADVPGGGAV